MGNIYISGDYLEDNPTWHAEDSPWKADQITNIIIENKIQPKTISEIGCGAGMILNNLSQKKQFKDAFFRGYDISPQAIEIAQRNKKKNIHFYCEDLLSEDNLDYFDILLVIDVLEHTQDYMGFLKKCREKAEYKIYHIPLDLHVSSMIRNAFIKDRYTIGHLHYFTADWAIATLKDTDHEILDHFYTNGSIALFKLHPSFKRALANILRWLFAKINPSLTARLFGGYSLLVLAK